MKKLRTLIMVSSMLAISVLAQGNPGNPPNCEPLAIEVAIPKS